MKLESELIDCRDVISFFIAIIFSDGHDANTWRKFQARRMARVMTTPFSFLLDGSSWWKNDFRFLFLQRRLRFPNMSDYRLGEENRKNADEFELEKFFDHISGHLISQTRAWRIKIFDARRIFDRALRTLNNFVIRQLLDMQRTGFAEIVSPSSRTPWEFSSECPEIECILYAMSVADRIFPVKFLASPDHKPSFNFCNEHPVIDHRLVTVPKYLDDGDVIRTARRKLIFSNWLYLGCFLLFFCRKLNCWILSRCHSLWHFTAFVVVLTSDIHCNTCIVLFLQTVTIARPFGAPLETFACFSCFPFAVSRRRFLLDALFFFFSFSF